MAEPVSIAPFQGMNNVSHPEGDLRTPEVILNADNTAQGNLIARQGKKLVKSLPKAHSLWANRDVMFVASKGTLYRFDPETEDLSQVTGLVGEGPVFYATVRTDTEQSVYISGPGMLGRFDLNSLVMDEWGTALPPRPSVGLVDGELEPGVYQVCYTKFKDGKMSGNGPILTVNVPEGKGLFFNNLSDNHIWMTDPGGGELQFLGSEKLVTEQPVLSEPLPKFGCKPPEPGLSHIWFYHGRMWGLRGKYLVYSEPFEPGLFHPANYFDLGEPGTMTAPVDSGMYIGTPQRTFYLNGTDPKQASMKLAGDGVVPGSIAFVKSLPEMSSTLRHHMGSNIPVWMSPSGIYAGSHEGMVISLTQRKVKLTPAGGAAAAVGRERHGDVQYLTSYKRKQDGTAASFGDSATADVVRKGKIIEEN